MSRLIQACFAAFRFSQIQLGFLRLNKNVPISETIHRSVCNVCVFDSQPDLSTMPHKAEKDCSRSTRRAALLVTLPRLSQHVPPFHFVHAKCVQADVRSHSGPHRSLAMLNERRSPPSKSQKWAHSTFASRFHTISSNRVCVSNKSIPIKVYDWLNDVDTFWDHKTAQH